MVIWARSGAPLAGLSRKDRNKNPLDPLKTGYIAPHPTRWQGFAASFTGVASVPERKLMKSKPFNSKPINREKLEIAHGGRET